MSVNLANKKQNEITLMNVSKYESKADYIRLTFPGIKTDEEVTEEFSDLMERGYIQDITCGTYNGISDKFTPWTLTDENILDTIFNELHETDFYNFVALYMEDLEQWSYADWIREYTEVYEAFIIDGRVYVNVD